MCSDMFAKRSDGWASYTLLWWPWIPCWRKKSTHWNPRASVRQAPESQPSVPVNLTCNWQGIKQSQIRERIGWDSEYLSHKRIGRLCRYGRRQKNIKCEYEINKHVSRISRCEKWQNQLKGADCPCITRSKLPMCNKIKKGVNNTTSIRTTNP